MSSWLVFCVAGIELAELSVGVLFASMLVEFLLSDEAVICSDDAPVTSAPLLSAFSVSASALALVSAASASALEDALSLAVEDAASHYLVHDHNVQFC